MDRAFTQAHRLDQVPEMAAAAAGLLLDIDPGDIEVTVEPHTDADSMIGRARIAHDAADEATEHAPTRLYTFNCEEPHNSCIFPSFA